MIRAGHLRWCAAAVLAVVALAGGHSSARAQAPDGGSVPAAGAARAVSTVAVNGVTVTLTLASAAAAGETVTVSSAPGANPIRDTADSEAAALTDEAVTNDTDRPIASTGVTAVWVGEEIVLSRDDPGNPAITGYAYRVRGLGETGWPPWRDIAGSGPETVSHGVPGLTVGAAYQAQTRVRVAATWSTASAAVATRGALPTLSIADAQAPESSGKMVFAVTLDVPSAQLMTVRHETSDGTATAGQDHARTSGTLTFAPGATERSIVARPRHPARGRWADAAGPKGDDQPGRELHRRYRGGSCASVGQRVPSLGVGRGRWDRVGDVGAGGQDAVRRHRGRGGGGR